MKRFHHFLLILFFASLSVRASTTRMMSCYLDMAQGGGHTDIFKSDGNMMEAGWISFRAQEGGNSAIHLAFTRALSEVGAIAPTEHVSAIGYFADGNKCVFGADVRDADCKEKLAEIGRLPD